MPEHATNPAALIDRILDTARGQLGHLDSDTEYGRWYGEKAVDPQFIGAPSCAIFASWVCDHAGFPLPELQHVGYSGAASAQLMLDGCRSRGWVLEDCEDALPGDILCFNWGARNPADHHIDHVGWCELPPVDHCVATIEDNTGHPTGVHRRIRSMAFVAAVIRLPLAELASCPKSGVGGPCWCHNSCQAVEAEPVPVATVNP